MEVIENGVHAQVYKPCLHVDAKVCPKSLTEDACMYTGESQTQSHAH